jgi:hypothetical protein
MGETRVDLMHLLEDLRDAYPGSLEETIVTEIVANSLDSGASRITFHTNHADSTITVLDDGAGMTRTQLRRYHDLATSTKQRGRGIGFAGVGIKLGLLACESVLTESRSGRSHVATRWHLKARHKAPWVWTDAPGIVEGNGTAVQLVLANALSELLDEGFIEATLRRHFQPLVESDFTALLSAHYPRGICFGVNDSVLEMDAGPDARVHVAVRLPRKRKAAAAGYIFRSSEVLPESMRGIGISTRGKVIRRGWDWLGLTPNGADRIGGLIEAPALADCLTLNKADFLRSGPRGAMYLAFRKSIQEALAEPLSRWDENHAHDDETRRRRARPLERDLRDVLARLARDFPLLDALAIRRPGGQRRLSLASNAASESPDLFVPAVESAPEDSTDGAATQEEASTPEREVPDAERTPENEEVRAELGTGAKKRRAHLGLRIDFEQLPESNSLGRLVESTIWVNESHPAYLRAAASRLQSYHLAVTVAMTLAPLAGEQNAAHEFVSAFLERWGRVNPRR